MDWPSPVELTRKLALDVAVRGGGHNFAGRATIDGGPTIDIALMKGIHVDPSRQHRQSLRGQDSDPVAVICRLSPSPSACIPILRNAFALTAVSCLVARAMTHTTTHSLDFRSAQHLSAQVPAFVPKAAKVALTMRR
jgi:hypothetical protein